MTGYRFELPPTATYRRRSCVWYTSPTFQGDGLLTVTLIHAKSFKVEMDAYAIEELGAEQFGTRRFQLVGVVNEHEPPVLPYVLVTGAFRKCGCECGAKGYKRAECKHIHAVEALIRAGKLPVRQMQGA